MKELWIEIDANLPKNQALLKTAAKTCDAALVDVKDIESIKKLKFGLQLMVYGQRDISRMLAEFKGEDYCHEVDDFVFGKYGWMLVNFDVARESIFGRRGRAFGGYGYSGWVCNTIMDKFILKQGPKIISVETSIPYYILYWQLQI